MPDTVKLANGVVIPCMGISTAEIPPSDTAGLVEQAVRDGYRLVAASQKYGNETEVGKGIRASRVDRNEIFVVSGVIREIGTYDKAANTIDESITAMNIGYIDLMLIDEPDPLAEAEQNERDIRKDLEVWRALEDALETGKVRAIGVSNFLQEDVDRLLAECKTPPMVNTASVHIGETPEKLLEYCEKHSIQLLAYSPMGKGRLHKDNEIKAIADKYGVTTSQVCLRYDIQLGTIPIVRMNQQAYLIENMKLDFELSEDDMSELRAMRDK